MQDEVKHANQHPDECPACHGFGYTRATATEWEHGKDGFKTHKQGSGCPRCNGTGRLEHA